MPHVSALKSLVIFNYNTSTHLLAYIFFKITCNYPFLFSVFAAVLDCVLIVTFKVFRRRQAARTDHLEYIQLSLSEIGKKDNPECQIEFHDDLDE